MIRNLIIIIVLYVVSASCCRHEKASEANLGISESDVRLQFSDSNLSQYATLISTEHGWEKVFRSKNETRQSTPLTPSFLISNESIYINDFGDSLFQLDSQTGEMLSKAAMPKLPRLSFENEFKYSQKDSIIIGRVQRNWIMFPLDLQYIYYLNPEIEFQELVKANAIINDSMIDVVNATSREKSILFSSIDEFLLIDMHVEARKDSFLVLATYLKKNGEDTIVTYELSRPPLLY